jgi:hypothetical protein
LLSRGVPRAYLDCRLTVARGLPGFHRAPSHCAARTFLWRQAPATILTHPRPQLSKCRTGVIGW